MAIRYDVRAEVVDIESDGPRKGESFYVDTNVWYWLTYSRASQADSPPLEYQATKYPSYVKRVRTAQARLVRCGLTLGELANVIERTERQIAIRTRQLGECAVKTFRHEIGRDSRQGIAEEISSAWTQVKRLADTLDVFVDDEHVDAVVSMLPKLLLDAHDLFVLRALRVGHLTQVITDDGDFATVEGLRVFTANRSVIEIARERGLLKNRG